MLRPAVRVILTDRLGEQIATMFMIARVSCFSYQVRRADTEHLWIVAPGDRAAHSNHRSVLRSAIYLRSEPGIALHFRAAEILA